MKKKILKLKKKMNLSVLLILLSLLFGTLLTANLSNTPNSTDLIHNEKEKTEPEVFPLKTSALQLLHSYDFESDTLGSDPAEPTLSTIEPAGCGTIQIADLGDGQNQHVEIHKDGGTQRMILIDDLTEGGTIDQEVGELHCMLYHDSSVMGVLFENSSSTLFRIDFWSGNVGRYNPTNVITSYTTNTWFELIVYFNMSKGWMFKIEDTLYGSGYAYGFEQVITSGVEEVIWATAYSGSNGYMRVDDIAFYSWEAPNELNIITPENTTYTEPMSGYYPATYGFENDIIGENPQGWSISEPGLQEAEIISSIDGHSNVLSLFDTESGALDHAVANNTFAPQTKGTVEFWYRTSGAQESRTFRIQDASTISVYLRVNSSNFEFYNASGWNIITTYNDEQWYHISIKFDCTSGTYNFSLNGNLIESNIDFYAPASYLDLLVFTTRQWGTSSDFYAYIDAVGYSWDPNYEIGDNLNEGLLLSYTNSTNLDWQGYSLDGQSNVTIMGNTTFTMPEAGTHTIQVFGNDTLGTDYASNINTFTIASIDLHTPENRTYYGPDAGYYPGTYGFEDKVISTNPSGWHLNESGGIITVSEGDEDHASVLDLYDTSTTYRIYTYKRESSAITDDNITIEFWWMTTESTMESDVRFYDTDYDSNIAVYLGIDEGNLRYHQGGGWHTVQACANNQWYHHRVVLDFTNQEFDWFIDGAQRIERGPFRDVATSFQTILIGTGHYSNTYHNYIDAIGYSWDPNYEIGDNLNEGLVLSYTNYTNLDWQGYSLDGQSNVTILGNTTIKMPDLGTHTIQVFGNDTLGTDYASNINTFTIARIDLHTPENRTYYGPDVGYYPGTYGFDSDLNGNDPTGWVLNEDAGSINVISNFAGHNKVVELSDTNGGDTVFMTNSFLGQSSGTVECWVRINSSNQGFGIYLCDGSTSDAIRVFFEPDGDLKYQDNSGLYVIEAYTADIWYHVRIEFEIASDWHLWINGQSKDGGSGYNFFGTPSAMDILYFDTYTPSTNCYLYVDAVGYSWDPNYEIGDNLNAGLVLSYTNSTNLDWQGYSLDGQSNVTIYGNTTLKMPDLGTHTIQVFGNDSEGNNYQTELCYFKIGWTAPDEKTYYLITPGANTIIDLRGFNENVYLECNVSDYAFLTIERQVTNFIGKGIWSDMIGHAFYSFCIYNTSFGENKSLLNEIIIRFYYDADEIEDEDNLVILHYKGSVLIVSVWEDVHGKINKEEHYIQITVSDLSFFCLCELEVGGRDKKKEEGDALWLFTEYGIFIIILAAIGVSIPTGYIVSKQKRKAQKQKKEMPTYAELEQSAAQKREALQQRTWKPEKPKKPGMSELKAIPGLEAKRPAIIPIVPKKKKTKEETQPKPLSAEEVKETEKTEAEMGIQEKQDKCTVHKGRIQGITYVCPKCQAKYCMKCAQTLEGKKEACWICGVPVDLGSEDETVVEDKQEYVMPINNEEKLINLIKKDIPLENISELNELNITALSQEFLNKLSKIEMDPKDKLDFLKEMLAITPNERDAIINRMLESDSEDFKG